jgi:hypothetical protein
LRALASFKSITTSGAGSPAGVAFLPSSHPTGLAKLSAAAMAAATTETVGADPVVATIQKARIPSGDLLPRSFPDCIDALAREARDPAVFFAAVWNLTDQAALARVAPKINAWRNWPVGNTFVPGSAPFPVECISDQAVLAGFAAGTTDPDLGGAAVVKLDDQAMLARVVVEAKNAEVGSAAVAKLTDLALLAMVKSEAESVRFGLIAPRTHPREAYR